MKGLSISNLSKIYPKSARIVLENISLTVKEGEFVSLIGPSGCGKSTLLSIIAGIENQTAGEVALHGKTLLQRTGKFGYMPQQATLLPWATVRENVELGLTISGVQKKQREEKANKLLTHFGLDPYANLYPNTLSGGMAQRVSLLRTILFNNRLLLLDEPFGALDALTRFSCQQWLLNVWEEYKSTVIFVTHDIREAILLSDRVCVMGGNSGKIIADIPIPLPRPRRKEQILSKQAVEIEKELLELLVR